MDQETKKKLDQVLEEMDAVIEDSDVPRNVREELKKAKKSISENSENETVNITRAIYTLNEASEDINIPFHTRTDIMNITSIMEEINEEVKEK